MSLKKFKTIILDGVEYKLIPKFEKFYLTTKELCTKTKRSKETIYKAKKNMKAQIHFSKPNNGKILFSDDAVAFILNGEHKNESIKRKCEEKTRQPISLSEFLS